MGGKGSGRPRKFRVGAIVDDVARNTLAAVVDYKITHTEREYRVIPLNPSLQPSGRAYWQRSMWLVATTMKSRDAVKTYKANSLLEERGCTCQCCVHEAMPIEDFDRWGEGRGKVHPAMLGENGEYL